MGTRIRSKTMAFAKPSPRYPRELDISSGKWSASINAREDFRVGPARTRGCVGRHGDGPMHAGARVRPTPPTRHAGSQSRRDRTRSEPTGNPDMGVTEFAARP